MSESNHEPGRLLLENETLRSRIASLERRLDELQTAPGLADQRRIEQALRESELKYRTLFETAGDAILLLREDRIVDCNARTLELFGGRRDQIVGATPAAISPPTQPDGRSSAELAAEKIALATGAGPQSFRWVHSRVDGSPFAAEVNLNRLELGGESLLQAIVHDVTERDAMEATLRKTGNQLSLILDNVSDIVFAIAVEPGGEYRFASVNRRFLEATGLSLSQIVGARVRDVVPEPAHDLVFGKYREAIERGRPARWEEVSEYPAGTKVGVVTVVPVFDGSGACTQLVGMVHDITERKQSELELQAAHEQLQALYGRIQRHAEEMEQRVNERTAQLKARNQELKEFTYTVSHDLKAPLRGIAGYANELDRKHRAGLSERARFCLSQIITASSHLDQLIEDLLQYSRLDAEAPSPTDIDPRQLVEALLRDRDLIIAEHHAEVTIDIPPGSLRAWERGLVQVLTNLIDNAIKYSRKSTPPRVRISAGPVEGAYRLAVSDNGIGFDMKYHDRIFGLFNRLVRLEEYEGTGAGLAIVKKVLDKQNGRVWAESAPGQGATFFVEIPQARETR